MITIQGNEGCVCVCFNIIPEERKLHVNAHLLTGDCSIREFTGADLKAGAPERCVWEATRQADFIFLPRFGSPKIVK